MAYFSLFTCLILLSLPSSLAGKSFRPKSIVLPVSKDPSTLQYITHINQRTPLVSLKLSLDLGGRFLWVDCEQGYVSSSYRPIRCGSLPCTLAGSLACKNICYNGPSPGCNNHTCTTTPLNTVIGMFTIGELAQDSIAVQSTNGKNLGRVVSVRRFLFSCGATILLEGLANGVNGMAGLGMSRISLPWQFSSSLGFPFKFSICLSSSTTSNGVLFFGDGQYTFVPDVNFSYKSLIHTPLIVNPVNDWPSSDPFGDPSADYYIQVKSINISGKPIPMNLSLLSINSLGFGGTKISTVHPYTEMETSIYNSFVTTFVEAVPKSVTRVAPVSPFKTCFKAKYESDMPLIDLVLEGKKVYWRIYGANSMVKIGKDVMCLGFLEGGSKAKTSIVIGGHQLEDNLLQFDLVNRRLGFSSSLLVHGTACSKFNFTSSNVV